MFREWAVGFEIERKFLVKSKSWRTNAPGIAMRQGYLSDDPLAVVRVRVAAERGFLTIKGMPNGIVRPEFEYEIPSHEAEQLLGMCAGRLVEKVRYVLPGDGVTWEVDVFSGLNTGLVVAECELQDADQKFSHPIWLAEEVSDDPRYANSNLATNPFTTW